ncbi:MAG: hypothetical protein HQM00_15265, partial [Magnetococcales bacterium]|nr:hypothetical protein [Magnetococcales bacterium]
SARVEEERLQAQRHIREQTGTAYRQNIDKLIAEEKRLTDAARQLAEQRRDFNLSISDRLARLSEKGLSPGRVYTSRQQRIASEQDQAEAALQNGNFEQARRHAERMIELAEQTAEAVKSGDRTIVSEHAAVAHASEQIRKAAEIADQAFQQQAESHDSSAAKLRQSYESASGELDRLHQQMAALDKKLAQEHQLILSANTEKVREAGHEIDDLLEKKERVVRIRTELQTGASSLETVVQNTAQGEPDHAMTKIDAAQMAFTRFKTEFAGWQPEIKATFDATSATGAMDGLMARFQELQSGMAPVALQADTSQAVAAIDTVRGQLDALHDKTITIDVVHREVEAHAAGGPVGFARGGLLPGFGGGDRIRALLEAGEFVIRKEAVRKYGLGLMESINRLRLTEMPRFATGGLVQRLMVPTLPPMPAFVSGGVVTPQVESVVRLELFSNGRPVASIPGPRQQVRQFVEALQEMQRGLR